MGLSSDIVVYTAYRSWVSVVPDTMYLDNTCMHIVNLAYLSKDAGRAAEAPLDWSHEEAIS